MKHYHAFMGAFLVVLLCLMYPISAESVGTENLESEHTDVHLLGMEGQPFIQWVTCIGGTGYEEGYSVQQTADGGFVVAGATLSSDGDMTSAGYHAGFDAFIAKYSSTGVRQWVTCIGGSGDDYGYSVQQTVDGGYVMTGHTLSSDGDMTGAGYHASNYDAFIAKYSSTGVRQWVTCIGGSNDDFGYSVQQTTDGGFVVAGATLSSDGDMTGAGYHGAGYTDAFLAKYSSIGVRQWVTCIGGTGSDYGYSVQQTTDGGFVVAGATLSSDGDMTSAGYHAGSDAFVAKYSSIGVRQWVTCIGGTGYDEGYSVQQTTDGGYVVTGHTHSSDGDMTSAGYHAGFDAFLAKYSSIGVRQWVTCICGSNDDFGQSMQQTTDGGYVVAGYTYSSDGDMTGAGYHSGGDAFLAKYSSIGVRQWVTCIGGGSSDIGQSVQQTTEGGYVVAGYTYSSDGDMTGAGYHSGGDAFLAKVSPPAYKAPVEIGVFRGAGQWFLDRNGNHVWDCTPTDGSFVFGKTGDLPAVTDWDNDNSPEIGIFRDGQWYVDFSGNYYWDGTKIDRMFTFGMTGDTPVIGDWNGDLNPDIGVFRGAGKWYLDTKPNHFWDGAGPGKDAVYTFGLAGDIPVIGDWDRDGHPDIGVFRGNGNWYVDYNGNYVWDGSVTDKVYSFGLAGDRPVTGDWNGDGIVEIGVFRAAKWYVDLNHNNRWDGTGTRCDGIYTFGLTGDLPVTGEWT